MPPKATDTGATVRERQIAAAAHARSKKVANGNSHAQPAYHTGPMKELPPISTNAPASPPTGVGILQGNSADSRTDSEQMAWSHASSALLETYRVAHNLPCPAAFTSPLNQALLTNPGIGRHSPTMARKKEKRRVSKDQLALAVRKNFNGAAVNEIDVVVELVYKVRNQDKKFRMRSTPSVTKKIP